MLDIDLVGAGEVILRTAIVYVVLVALLRLAGKREVGQLSILELIVLLLLSDAVQNSMVGDDTSLPGGLIAAATLIGVDRVLAYFTARSNRLRHAIEGEPRLLVRNGRLLEKALREEQVEPEEVRAAIRGEGLARVEDVKMAVLETDGTISVVPLDRESGSS